VKRLAPYLIAAVLVLAGCTGAAPGFATAPRCSSVERLGLVAQSVPTSSYVPCISKLATGWRSDELVIRNGGTTFDLVSDRAPNHPARIEFRRSCTTSGAVPVPPRTLGGRTLLALRTISPRFAGQMYDVFPGGCVTYTFDFQRGPHIALMAELESAVGFVPRTLLSRSLTHRLGVELP
jgi:hypothetical protein